MGITELILLRKEGDCMAIRVIIIVIIKTILIVIVIQVAQA